VHLLPNSSRPVSCSPLAVVPSSVARRSGKAAGIAHALVASSTLQPASRLMRAIVPRLRFSAATSRT
jgi:hypothetical protein